MAYNFSLSQHHDATRHIIKSLAVMILESGSDTAEFDHFMEVNEFGLAIEALAYLVNNPRD